MSEYKTIVLEWSDECPQCGSSDIEVYTDCEENNKADDGDTARCLDCNHEGWVCVVDENNAYINWYD